MYKINGYMKYVHLGSTTALKCHDATVSLLKQDLKGPLGTQV